MAFFKTNGQFVLESVEVTREAKTLRTDYVNPIWIEVEVGQILSETPKGEWGSWGNYHEEIVGRQSPDGEWVVIGTSDYSWGDDGMYSVGFSFNPGISTTVYPK